MFEGWMFLLLEIWALLLMAALLGLLCGWIIWARAPILDKPTVLELSPPLPVLEAQNPSAQAGLVLNAASDDLRRIRGIGAKLEA